MLMEITELLQLGTTGALFAWFVYWYFQVQKTKKEPINGIGKAILNELQTQNNNHLHAIGELIETQTKINHDDHQKQIEVLVAIKTILEERR